MRIRRVIITRESNIENLANLPEQSSVKTCWRLPFNYTMFEFYHPVFERIYDDRPSISNAARAEDWVRRQTAAAIAEERRLLAPLYRDFHNPSDALILLVPSRVAIYHFVGKGKGQIAWPELNCAQGWEVSKRIRIKGQMIVAIEETVYGLQTVIRDWAVSMKGIGIVTQIGEIVTAGESFTINFECSAFSGDAVMALYILLTETRNLTSIQTLHFAPAGW